MGKNKWYKQRSALNTEITYVGQLPAHWLFSPADYPYPQLELEESEAERLIAGLEPEYLRINNARCPFYAVPNERCEAKA